MPGGFDISLAMPTPQSASREAMDSSQPGVASDASILRTLRVIRLAKLVRLVRASRLYRRYQAGITVTSSTQTITQCTLLLFVGAHWYACLIGIQTSLHEKVGSTWLGPDRYDYCSQLSDLVGPAASVAATTTADELAQLNEAGDGLGAAAAWNVPLAECASMGLFSYYVASLTWALMLITGTGGTDYCEYTQDPNPRPLAAAC